MAKSPHRRPWKRYKALRFSNSLITMQIPFYKYQGTGNDFILLDQRDHQFLQRTDLHRVHQLCDRRFGIGADGLILLQNRTGYDFEMVYFNADGQESSMCGNGGRCIAAFAQHLGIVDERAHFLAIDGPHEALVRADQWVDLKMSDVDRVQIRPDHYELDTGSPHYVTFVEDVDDIQVVENGQAIRYSKAYRAAGINVNFVEKRAVGISVLTYERGVEDETLSCGTGVTAAAIAYYLAAPSAERQTVDIQTKGGQLRVRFRPDERSGFRDIWLGGPATRVFRGSIRVD